jgi:large subunit ribosomal protein L27
MAHTKQQKAARANKDSKPKYRGIKAYGGQTVAAGNIIVRQKGTKFWPGEGVLLANDFTLMATKAGKVKFLEKRGKQYVSVE